MTTMKMHNATTISVEGTRTTNNCKTIYDITTGTFYASVGATAEAFGVDISTVSHALSGKRKIKTVAGHRICYAIDIMEHLEEIAAQTRSRYLKVKAYDEMMAKKEELANTKVAVAKHKNRVAKLLADLNRERQLLSEAEAKLAELEGGNENEFIY